MLSKLAYLYVKSFIDQENTKYIRYVNEIFLNSVNKKYTTLLPLKVL